MVVLSRARTRPPPGDRRIKHDPARRTTKRRMAGKHQARRDLQRPKPPPEAGADGPDSDRRLLRRSPAHRNPRLKQLVNDVRQPTQLLAARPTSIPLHARAQPRSPLNTSLTVAECVARAGRITHRHAADASAHGSNLPHGEYGPLHLGRTVHVR